MRTEINDERRKVMGQRYTPWAGGFTCRICDAPLLDCDSFCACPKHWDRVVEIVRPVGRELELATA
jgi:hypothetical protein